MVTNIRFSAASNLMAPQKPFVSTPPPRALSDDVIHLRKQRWSVFECFPYVCPEPVLVKRSHSYTNGSKRPRFSDSDRCLGYRGEPSGGWVAVVDRQTALASRKRAFFEFSLCLSRACLGKNMTIYIHKWLKKPRFLTLGCCNSHRRRAWRTWKRRERSARSRCRCPR